MVGESPVFQQASEPVTSPVGRPVGILPAGVQTPADSRSHQIPATLTFPRVTVVHQREEEDGEALLEDQTPTPKIHPEELRTETQIPRNPKPVTSLPLRCHLRQDFTYGDRQ